MYKGSKRSIMGSFSPFWSLLLRANFRGSRVPEMPFSCLHVKIKCWEVIWVPSAHRKKSESYPLKLALKFIFFRLWNFFMFFPFKYQILVTNTLQNEIFAHRVMYRIIRESQDRHLGMLNGPFIAKISSKQPKSH